MAVLSRMTLKLCEIFCGFFLEKRPITVKLSKFCSKVFIATPINVVVSKFREIWPTGNRALFT